MDYYSSASHQIDKQFQTECHSSALRITLIWLCVSVCVRLLVDTPINHKNGKMLLPRNICKVGKRNNKKNCSQLSKQLYETKGSEENYEFMFNDADAMNEATTTTIPTIVIFTDRKQTAIQLPMVKYTVHLNADSDLWQCCYWHCYRFASHFKASQ